MLPRTTSIWQRDSQPNASGRPGAVHAVLTAVEQARLTPLGYTPHVSFDRVDIDLETSVFEEAHESVPEGEQV